MLLGLSLFVFMFFRSARWVAVATHPVERENMSVNICEMFFGFAVTQWEDEIESECW